MISKACFTIRTAITFLPLLRPLRMIEQTRRSTIGHWALRKRFFCQRPCECGRNCAYFGLHAM